MHDEHEEKIINEEYKIWKKNTPFLYDLVLTHALEWPTLTLQWFPERQTASTNEYYIQRLLLGTHTSGEPNHVMIAEVKLPLDDTPIDPRKYDDQRGEIGGYQTMPGKVEIKQSINHDGDVNRARYMPQNPTIIATKTASGAVFIFDYTKHPSVPPSDGKCKPDMTLAPQPLATGSDRFDYALAWNPLQAGQIAAGAADFSIHVWDINKGRPLGTESVVRFVGHTQVVEDVAWHNHHEAYLGSVGDDKRFVLWDVRQPTPVQSIEAHSAEVYTVAFNPFSEWIFCTGGGDRVVVLWDLRNLKTKLHTFVSHTSEVFQVHWAPFNETILASCAGDRRIHIWDVSKIKEPQSPEDAEDGPPELLFIHGGHTAKVTDFGWNPVENWIIASAAEDNILQIWQMAEHIYHDIDDETTDA
jgi:histone-binding protein RBBP4